MNAVFLHGDRDALEKRRQRALDSVGLSREELKRQIESGTALTDEREAWEEVGAAEFLLGNLSG